MHRDNDPARLSAGDHLAELIQMGLCILIHTVQRIKQRIAVFIIIIRSFIQTLKLTGKQFLITLMIADIDGHWNLL